LSEAAPIPLPGTAASEAARGADVVRPLASRADRELLALSADGDRAAFGTLVERHLATLTAILRQRLGPRAAVEDLLQEVFARTLANVGGFQGRSSYVTWATSIGLNLAIDWQRKTTRRRRLAPPADVEADTLEHPAATRSLELVERRDEARRAREVLEDLPDDMRVAVTLRVVQDLSYAEVAHRMEAPVPRVRTWVSRGLKRLRAALEARPETPVDAGRVRVGRMSRLEGDSDSGESPSLTDAAGGPPGRGGRSARGPVDAAPPAPRGFPGGPLDGKEVSDGR